MLTYFGQKTNKILFFLYFICKVGYHALLLPPLSVKRGLKKKETKKETEWRQRKYHREAFPVSQGLKEKTN
jgi:hypothetical protein